MVSFKMFAGTNVGLRENNEDNFTVCPDLTKNEWIVPADNQQVVQLGQRGAMMVVADGMGGQNAGEVASAIAIDTIQDVFSPNHMSEDVLGKPDAIKLFLKKAISECDIRIKKRTETESSTYGMGSTIVIAWLIGCKLYVAWLGDSRAYSFVKGKGIARLSKDHSYVQQLVDAGAITDEEAMDHPNSNVITRSLGDTSQRAKADVAEYDIEDGQIILLCSDGLCGVCKDEEIGGIIEDGGDDLQKCKESLTRAALVAGGSDNITISLMQLKVDSAAPSMVSSSSDSRTETASNKNGLAGILALILGGALLLSLIYVGISIIPPKKKTPEYKLEISVDNDTLSIRRVTRYHVMLAGDDGVAFDMNYDKTLLSINAKDSTVKAIDAFENDTTTCLKIICRQSPKVRDSVWLTIKSVSTIFMEEITKKIENENNPGGIKTIIGPTLNDGSNDHLNESPEDGMSSVTEN